MSRSLLDRQCILIDADDTLWENNIYFERAFDDFVAFLNHQHLTRAEIQAVLDEITIANRGPNGYGARAFARNLVETYRRVSDADDDDPNLAVVERLGLRILEEAHEAIDGVEETIAALRPHHRLYLFTKGHDEEQRQKIERSGLIGYFDDVLITDEKHVEVYREAVTSLGLDTARTWMVGNSPRSDINPALAAGIHAILIPHPRTWHLEVEDVVRPDDAPGTLIELTSFRELTTVFVTTALIAAHGRGGTLRPHGPALSHVMGMSRDAEPADQCSRLLRGSRDWKAK